MSAIEVIRRERKKNKKLQTKLDKKKDTQELEQMITKLKVQIEEDKIIEEALKELLRFGYLGKWSPCAYESLSTKGEDYYPHTLLYDSNFTLT